MSELQAAFELLGFTSLFSIPSNKDFTFEGRNKIKLELLVIKFPAVTQNMNQQLTGGVLVARSGGLFCLCQEN